MTLPAHREQLRNTFAERLQLYPLGAGFRSGL